MELVFEMVAAQQFGPTIHYSEDDVKVAVKRAKQREKNTGKYPEARGLDEEKQ